MRLRLLTLIGLIPLILAKSTKVTLAHSKSRTITHVSGLSIPWRGSRTITHVSDLSTPSRGSRTITHVSDLSTSSRGSRTITHVSDLSTPSQESHSITHVSDLSTSSQESYSITHGIELSTDLGASSQEVQPEASNTTPAVTTSTESTATLKASNSTCEPMPLGKGPVPSSDTAYAFLNSDAIQSNATSAPTPAGYERSFQNLHASSSGVNSLGYLLFDTYDTETCATKCDEKEGCLAVNIYYERAPSLDVGDQCPDPPSTTNIKCVFWGVAVDESNTKNSGYTDLSFVVAIAGSNGYTKGSGAGSVGKGSDASPRVHSTPNYALLLAPLFLSSIWYAFPNGNC